MADGSRQIGVLGGSFNPPHLGHLIIASEARWLLGLDQVLFVLAADPPHKPIADGVPAAERLSLTQAALAGEPGFAVSTVEVDRGLRFTVDTLAALREQLPEARLTFIAGSDSLLALQTWREPERILSLCRFAVAPRPGDDEEAIRAAANRWGASVCVLSSVRIGISSTDVRERVRTGRPVRFLVPDAVERLIAEKGWYRDS
jgi:nicotinate-nucleotide adenylyltransferase